MQIRVVRKVDAGFRDPPLDLVLRLLEHSSLNGTLKYLMAK